MWHRENFDMARATKTTQPTSAGPSGEVFIRQLDAIVDISMRTRACLDAFASKRAAEKAARKRSLQRWISAKQATLAAVFVIAFLQYYMLDVCVEIISMRPVALIHPGAPAKHKSMLDKPSLAAVGKQGRAQQLT